MKATRVVLSILGAGSIIACGSLSSGTMSDPSSGSDAISIEDQTALSQVRMIEGRYEDLSSSPECLTLRAKLFGERQRVKMSSEFRSIADLPEYKALQRDEQALKVAGCRPGAMQPTACPALQTQLEQDVAKLRATPAWQALDNNRVFRSLITDFANAQQLDCIKAP